MPKKTAAQRLSERISSYSKLTQSELYSRMEEFNIAPTKMLKYVKATQSYNKNLEYTRRRYEKIFTQQFEKMHTMDSKYYSTIKSGKKRITNAGKTARNLYVQNALEEVAPSQNKSIVPGKSSIEHYGFEHILESREHTASMKLTQYFDWRNSIYFENWKAAVRKTFEKPDTIIDEYDKLSSDEKLAFMVTPAGKIDYYYTDESLKTKIEELFSAMMFCRIYTVDEYEELRAKSQKDYDVILDVPDYIFNDVVKKWWDEINKENENNGE